MTIKPLVCAALAGLAAASLFAQEPAPSPQVTPTPWPADQPAEKTGSNGPRFLELHEAFLQRGKSGPISLLFLGDSITEGWSKSPEVWNEYYAKYQPANFGISGDKTEHVLWRIDHGELDGLDPQVLVLMIGTNNTGGSSAAEITAGIQAIIQRIQTKLPKTKILLLGIFPRGPRKSKEGIWDDGVTRMEKIRSINQELAKMENGRTLRYLDITPKLLGDDGKIPDAIMPDQLHPNTEGYKIWAAAMQSLLDEMITNSKIKE